MHICKHTFCHVVMLAWHIERGGATCLKAALFERHMNLSMLPLPSSCPTVGDFVWAYFWASAAASFGFL